MDGIARRAYSVTEVAKALGVSDGYVRQLLRKGQIPARKLGKRWPIPAGWLDEFASCPAADPHGPRDIG